MSITLQVVITNNSVLADGAAMRLRSALTRRAPLHAHLAAFGAAKLRKDISSIQSHTTANRLGARPSNHLAKAARSIEGQSDEQKAAILLPRKSRLRAAFGAHTISPGAGKTYLTLPAHKVTYGKRPAESGHELSFAMLGRFRALIFTAGNFKGEVAYWLKREVTIKEDKTIIPFSILSADLADETSNYMDQIINAKGGQS